MEIELEQHATRLWYGDIIHPNPEHPFPGSHQRNGVWVHEGAWLESGPDLIGEANSGNESDAEEAAAYSIPEALDQWQNFPPGRSFRPRPTFAAESPRKRRAERGVSVGGTPGVKRRGLALNIV